MYKDAKSMFTVLYLTLYCVHLISTANLQIKSRRIRKGTAPENVDYSVLRKVCRSVLRKSQSLRSGICTRDPMISANTILRSNTVSSCNIYPHGRLLTLLCNLRYCCIYTRPSNRIRICTVHYKCGTHIASDPNRRHSIILK